MASSREALLTFYEGRYSEAEQQLSSAIKESPDAGTSHSSLAANLNNLAVLYRIQGRYAEAEPLYERSLAIYEGEAPNSETEIATVLNNTAVLHTLRHNYGSAKAFVVRAQALWEKAQGSGQASALALNNLGVIEQALGEYDGAKSAYEQALALWRASLGPEHLFVGQCLNNYAALCRTQGQYGMAETLFQQALRVWDRNIGPGHLLGAENLDALPRLYQRLGLFSKLDPQSQRGPLIREDPLWSEHPTGAQRLEKYGDWVRNLRQELGDGQKNFFWNRGGGNDMARTKVQETLEQLRPWYQNIELAPGIWTNPPMKDHPVNRWRALKPSVPQDLTGKTVLDIGCNAGFFSIHMKMRGAARVVGIDIMPYVLAQARFVSDWFNQPIELRELSAYDVESLGQFDIVNFVGVLYHLKHPLYALEKAAAVCKETMFFQSVVRGSTDDFEPADDYPISESKIFDKPAYPKLYFVEKSFNDDVSNWWFATRSCLKAMLRTVGFKTIHDTSNSDLLICQK